MLDCPDLAVPREVMQHVVHVESSRNPFAIGVVGGYLARQPRSLDEALAAVRVLKDEGYNFSVGIAQVNRYNLAKYGLGTYAQAFEVCPNLQAGSRILRECYDRALDWGKAFSCYYSGNFVTGFDHGYVQKIFASIRKAQYSLSGQAEPPIRVIPYGNTQRKKAREDSVPLGEPSADKDKAVRAPGAYPEAGVVKATPAETAESRPAIPVPGPGAVMPASPAPASGGLAGIPTQVIGVNGDPYQTRVLPPAPKPADIRLPPVQNPKPAASVARKGGSLLHPTESSGKPENTTGASASGGSPAVPQQPPTPADRSFVF
jgi:type IV secretion system protein VirB1